MKLRNKITKIYDAGFIKRNIFLSGLFLLILLLFRNPFGERTLIPNLEPYPDTLHYIVPARSFADGGVFKLTREFGEMSSNVAPLYSILLIPFYVIKSDPRMFYFLNMLLSIVGFYLFYRIIDYLIENKWIVGLTLFIYVTNYYIYWYPQWAMAENLTLTLFLSAIYLLSRKVTGKRILIAAFLSASFYATKFAYPTLTMGYFVLYLVKILDEKHYKLNKRVVSTLLKFLAAFFIFQILVFYYQYVQHGATPLDSLLSFSESVRSEPKSANPWFSSQYFGDYLHTYIDAIVGGKQRFLWSYEPLYQKWLFYLSVPGLLIYSYKKRTRLVISGAVIMVAATVFLMSFFYTTDVRYIYHVIPVIVLGLGLTLKVTYEYFREKDNSAVFYLIFIGLAGAYLMGNFIRIKDQAVINFKYAEVPWYYKSVLVLNDYFDDFTPSPESVYVISPMIPYYIDLYSNGNYNLLPLSPQQDFRNQREEIWGPGDYNDLIGLYNNKLIEDNDLYVYTYGLGNEGYLHASLEGIREEFLLTEVVNECHSQCVLYKIENIDG